VIELKDQLNRTVRLEKFPERIVSLVPSQTELLHDLGLGERVVGITKFCIHPEWWFKTKARVGGTKNLDLAAIRALRPDLVIGNKEENSKTDIALIEKEFPLYMSDIFTVEDALQMINDVGALTNRRAGAGLMTQKIREDFAAFPQLNGTVLYLIWVQPWMAVGDHTFIGDLVRRTGLVNVFTENDTRYVELSDDDIAQLNPDYIFLSSEPFPFKEKHAAVLRRLSGAKMVFTDGEMFSWYGSRMLKMPAYFTNLQQQLRHRDNW
jgi:ABC-type Fe3+-hydroxamate transport system substrate-binding protein